MNGRIGMWAAILGIAIYAGYLVTGFVWLFSGGLRSPDPYRPPDPYMAILQVLLLLMDVALVVVLAAVHGQAPPQRRTFSLVALAFAILFAGLTISVHFVWLTVLRRLPADAVPALLRPDPWPSLLLALDLLAWGPVLGLALLAAAPAIGEGKLQTAIQLALLLGGLLSLAGGLGPALGDLRYWAFAMANYLAVLPAVCCLLAIRFRSSDLHAPDAPPAPAPS
jgi:hypothetical protein